MIILRHLKVQVNIISQLPCRPADSELMDMLNVFTGNVACRRGGRNGFIFTPACFITSEAFLNRLMKGNAAEADGSFYRLPASVPPDSGNQTTASEIYIPKLI